MKITELILKTASIQRTRLFYHKTLELPIVSETGQKISFRVGHSKLTFEAVQHEKPFYHFAFNITNNHFSSSFEWINNKLDILPVNEEGMLIAVYNNWNAQSFYFTDNNGSILEFISRFDLPYHSNEPFSVKDIVEISEIGLVTTDVPGLCSVLTTEEKVPYYAKGPRLHDFVAMGDEHGLLLVSAKDRGWVPTHRLAQPFPVIVKGASNFEFHLP